MKRFNSVKRQMSIWMLCSVIVLPAVAQESAFDKWKKESDNNYKTYRKEADEELKNFIEGWDNSFFSVDELSSQEANTEAIIVEEEATDQSDVNVISLPPSATSGIKLWAIVVGVSKYAVEKHNLNYADDDAQRFARFLASPEGGSIPEERLFMHIDEDADQISVFRTLVNVFGQAGENDGIIFYFSGHGSPSSFILHDYGSPNVYMVDGKQIEMVDNRKGLLPHRYLNHIIDQSKAKYKYCIIDACHSASMLETKSKSITELSKLGSFYAELDKSNSGSVYMLSSREDEYSYENRVQQAKLRGGYFTHFLMQGIRGDADYNKDRIVTVVEAFDYCKRSVVAVTGKKQSPVISGQYSFNMPIGVIRN